jgi:hypothetical protein
MRKISKKEFWELVDDIRHNRNENKHGETLLYFSNEAIRKFLRIPNEKNLTPHQEDLVMTSTLQILKKIKHLKSELNPNRISKTVESKTPKLDSAGNLKPDYGIIQDEIYVLPLYYPNYQTKLWDLNNFFTYFTYIIWRVVKKDYNDHYTQHCGEKILKETSLEAAILAGAIE